ncbi:chromate transporter [Acidovorax sp. 56]|uniref:chromate efflux transporter n=1 Tax=Acidovorax sp. 56 TaxID=2035205 RepID=UPI000C163376|nr:chromate efflux transporter [Acidovorax sp. 56]PIF26089.1 chromate transporter [Acidovorax sp. 56]
MTSPQPPHQTPPHGQPPDPLQAPLSPPTAFSPWAVLWVFLRLGLTSFGGPVAHLGYFRDELVVRRRWLDEHSYADLVALCQFLPGPASSQVGMALGLMRSGWLGALAAWVGFTLPSALVLAALGLGFSSTGAGLPAGLVQGLKVVAVAVVAQAVWGMARSLCTSAGRMALMGAACAITLWQPGVAGQMGAMLGAALVGWWAWGRGPAVPPAMAADDVWALPYSRRAGLALLAVFAVLLVALPWWVQASAAGATTATNAANVVTGWAVLDAFYRAGALVFGGGHVVLPLLQSAVVPTGWVAGDAFLAGYGAAQAVPGPLFTFAAFLGAAMAPGWAGAGFAVMAVLGIFLPAFLLVAGALPWWAQLRQRAGARGLLAGVNAAVVGLLLAALWHPVASSALHGPADVALAAIALAALLWWRVPPWAVVLATALAGWGWQSVVAG